MINILTILLAKKNYLPIQWYISDLESFSSTISNSVDIGIKNYHQHQFIELINILNTYTNATGKFISIKDNITDLYNRQFIPVSCYLGMFHLFGICGFEKDIIKSFRFLDEGRKKNIWTCIDLLTFHPYTDDPLNASYNGLKNHGVWSLIQYVKLIKNKNISESIFYLNHLLHTYHYKWMRTYLKNDTSDYENIVKDIVVSNYYNKTKLKELVSQKHLLAGLWLADYYTKKSKYLKAFDILADFVDNGPWIPKLNTYKYKYESYDLKKFIHNLKIKRNLNTVEL